MWRIISGGGKGDGMNKAKPLILFSLSAVLCAVVDYSVYMLLQPISQLAPFCYAIARIISSTVNFLLNRSVVFRSKERLKAAVKYYLLVLVNALIGSLIVNLLKAYDITAVYAKLIIDVILFMVNYVIQRAFIFT
ncbi:MAG: GtrA family protein [Oscillospiraceae bacterium]|nr:GtrA family protein [Oscillospiraceae bacterium]